MNKLEKLPDDQINSLIATERLVLQYDTTGQRVAVGLPFALEVYGNERVMCCPEGRFLLRHDLPVLWSRLDDVDSVRWGSICDQYMGLVAYDAKTDSFVEMETPSQIAREHGSWLLAFVRTCLVVQVASTPVSLNVMPDAKATLPVKSRGLALDRVRVRVRRYRPTSRSWRR